MTNTPILYLADASLGAIKGTGRFYTDPASSPSQVDNIFTMVVTFLTIVGGLTFLIYFIIGGLSWVSAGGDAKKVESAKSNMTNGAIGMIIIVASYSIIWIVGKVLGVDILNPGSTISSLFGS